MKTSLIILFSFLLISFQGLAQSKTVKSEFKVYGNCGMCKERIESALDKSGVKSAQWDTRTKNIVVVYNSKKISEREIHETIAAVGHDTDSVKAPLKVYGELPFCCLYRDHDHSNIVDDPHKH